jgi:hypothetical protein
MASPPPTQPNCTVRYVLTAKLATTRKLNILRENSDKEVYKRALLKKYKYLT